MNRYFLLGNYFAALFRMILTGGKERIYLLCCLLIHNFLSLVYHAVANYASRNINRDIKMSVCKDTIAISHR